MIFTVPFKTNVPYSFTSNVGGSNFRFHIKYCISDDTYFMDVDKYTNGSYKNIINCVSITTGCDLFISFKYYGLGTLFVVPTDNRYLTEIPHSDTIVSKYTMIWEHS